MSTAIGYYNGKIGPLEEMTCPINDRAMYYGDGCYDAALSANGKVFLLEEHIDRFFNSCRLLDIPFHMSKTELAAEIQKVIDAYGGGKGLVYWQATRGTANRVHQYGQLNLKPNLLIFMKPGELPDREITGKLITAEDKRFEYCHIKTLNLLPNCLIREKARQAGCDEAILYRRGGRVTECTHSNISIIKDGVFRTAPTDQYILPGISRKHILLQCEKLEIPVDETPFNLVDLMNADEVIMSASGWIYTIITEIDGIPVGGKATALAKKLRDAVYDEFEEYTSK